MSMSCLGGGSSAAHVHAVHESTRSYVGMRHETMEAIKMVVFLQSGANRFLAKFEFNWKKHNKKEPMMCSRVQQLLSKLKSVLEAQHK